MEKQYCILCGSEHIHITYKGKIRDGALETYTAQDVIMWKCNDCEVIWYEKMHNPAEYYGSKEYRIFLENTSEEEDFYDLHDRENLDKFSYMGQRYL